MSEHPSVGDAVVIGLADEEWGHRVHFIVQPMVPGGLSEPGLIVFAEERLAVYEVPKTAEFLKEVPRIGARKGNRSALVPERRGEA